MDDPLMASFIYNLSMHEVAVAMSNGKISYNEACDFAVKVIDRFRNPFIDHQWLSITVQYSSKMKMRTIPLLIRHYHRHSYTPEYMALGFAAYLLFMKSTNENGTYVGLTNNTPYPVHDDHAAYFAELWKHKTADQLVDAVLADKRFWESDLTSLNGFADAVKRELHLLMQDGVAAALRNVTLNKTTVPS
jgi:tagaturonate reductase